MLVNGFHLDEHLEDDIVWKHSNDGIYTAATVYKAQFLGLTLPPWTAWFGKFGLPPRSIFLHGWLFKIGFGPPIACRNGAVQIVAFAPSAEGATNGCTPLL